MADGAYPSLKSATLYTVAWIVALPLELAAALIMLDEQHGAPVDFIKNRSDDNSYCWGRLRKHNIVLASLPSGEYGISSATTTANRLCASLPHIRVGLLVGIAGGVPQKDNTLLLGDVVVSQPDTVSGGVVQHDLYKALKRKGESSNRNKEAIWYDKQRKGWLNSPPRVLMTALSTLQGFHETGRRQLEDLLTRYADNQDMCGRYTFQGCDKDPLRSQADLTRTKVSILYGTVGSGNTLMKTASERDQILNWLESENIRPLCFEMEAAGLMNNFPCIVIRGICDYADEFKDDKWQRYAAATAAAFAAELLSYLDAEATEATSTIENIQVINDSRYYASNNVQVTNMGGTVTMVIISPTDLYNQSYEEHCRIGWQQYWHRGVIHPSSTKPGGSDELADQERDYPDTLRVLFHDPGVLHTDSNSHMEDDQLVQLVTFMSIHDEMLLRAAETFPQGEQRFDVFNAMHRMTMGRLDKDGSTGRTLLHWFAMNDIHEHLSKLIKIGFKVDDRDSDSRTPLHLAILGCHYSTVRELVEECGASTTIRDLNGMLPWNLAVSIDSDNSVDNDQREMDKDRILRLLARHTDLQQVKSKIPWRILYDLKRNPDANIYWLPERVEEDRGVKRPRGWC